MARCRYRVVALPRHRERLIAGRWSLRGAWAQGSAWASADDYVNYSEKEEAYTGVIYGFAS